MVPTSDKSERNMNPWTYIDWSKPGHYEPTIAWAAIVVFIVLCYTLWHYWVHR